MPRSSKKPCSAPSCGALTDSRFCAKHKATKSKHKTKVELGYDYGWIKLSKRYKQANPLCVHCLAKDKIVPVEICDHIIPVHIHPDGVKDEDNLQSLCRSCHHIKTQEDLLKYGSANTHSTFRFSTQP